MCCTWNPSGECEQDAAACPAYALLLLLLLQAAAPLAAVEAANPVHKAAPVEEAVEAVCMSAVAARPVHQAAAPEAVEAVRMSA